MNSISAGMFFPGNRLSCREQIRQGTGRQALHLAQVLELALTQAGSMEQVNPQEKVHASQAAS